MLLDFHAIEGVSQIVDVKFPLFLSSRHPLVAFVLQIDFTINDLLILSRNGWTNGSLEPLNSILIVKCIDLSVLLH